MNNDITQKLLTLDSIYSKMNELKPFFDEYLKMLFQAEKLKKEIKKYEKNSKSKK